MRRTSRRRPAFRCDLATSHLPGAAASPPPHLKAATKSMSTVSRLRLRAFHQPAAAYLHLPKLPRRPHSSASPLHPHDPERKPPGSPAPRMTSAPGYSMSRRRRFVSTAGGPRLADFASASSHLRAACLESTSPRRHYVTASVAGVCWPSVSRRRSPHCHDARLAPALVCSADWPTRAGPAAFASRLTPPGCRCLCRGWVAADEPPTPWPSEPRPLPSPQ